MAGGAPRKPRKAAATWHQSCANGLFRGAFRMPKASAERWERDGPWGFLGLRLVSGRMTLYHQELNKAHDALSELLAERPDLNENAWGIAWGQGAEGHRCASMSKLASSVRSSRCRDVDVPSKRLSAFEVFGKVMNMLQDSKSFGIAPRRGRMTLYHQELKLMMLQVNC